MDWMVRGSNPVAGEIFRIRPDRPWGPPILLYNRYRISFPGVKRPGRGVDHPPPCSADVKERVEPYLYSTSGSSWPVLENLLFTCTFTAEVQHSTETRYVTKRTLSNMFHVEDYVCRVLGSSEYKNDCFKTT